ncbi:ATP-binding protein [Streptomyces sp. DSM 40868]|nr:ATP-binding protein [Streptomyces sp. DSM 40868]
MSRDHGCGSPTTHAAIDLCGFKAPQSAARRVVRTALAGKADGEYLDDVVLVADELVGNAVEHAGEALAMVIDVYNWGVAVQVRDREAKTAEVPEKPLAAGEDDEHGRGLLLVDALASAWGVQRDSAGKRVTAIFMHRTGDAE